MQILFLVSLVFSACYFLEAAKCSGSLRGYSFCYYDPGSRGSNVIISAPHGGSLKPSSIPDRSSGCFKGDKCKWWHGCGKTSSKCKAKTFQDSYTKQISVMLADELKKVTGTYNS